MKEVKLSTGRGSWMKPKYRLYTLGHGALSILVGLSEVLTVGFWRPFWVTRYTAWGLKHNCWRG